MTDSFHPDLSGSTPVRNRVHHIRAGALDGGTAQTDGMARFAAISGSTVGSEKLWMGGTHVDPGAASQEAIVVNLDRLYPL